MKAMDSSSRVETKQEGQAIRIHFASCGVSGHMWVTENAYAMQGGILPLLPGSFGIGGSLYCPTLAHPMPSFLRDITRVCDPRGLHVGGTRGRSGT